MTRRDFTTVTVLAGAALVAGVAPGVDLERLRACAQWVNGSHPPRFTWDEWYRIAVAKGRSHLAGTAYLMSWDAGNAL